MVHLPRWVVRLHLPSAEYATRVALVEALSYLDPRFDPAHSAVEVSVSAADAAEATTYVRNALRRTLRPAQWQRSVIIAVPAEPDPC